ncbi:protein of unknown function DUF58 [Chloroherpeton thalassium ATCC 35110]|uniref:DUF58 domain-containing protein n=2 Tax=Chloroherpeton thalassium TaxID=100716 RepID=B3QX77_CHLT3|nr:protein of unknown function DUF58 [Chloroherpeton thalassium ATCC 35110]
MNDYRKYLQPETVSKLSSIELKAKLIVAGFLIGLHKSPYHGFSVEFAEHRQYAFGDEIRHIDWKVFARTDKYYVKQYEEETNLRSYILLDASSSMQYRSEKKSIPKIEYAAYLAAALSLLMIRQRDGVGLVTFTNNLHDFIPPSVKPSHHTFILKKLAEVSQLVTENKNRQTDVSSAFAKLAERIQNRSLVIVISDFWDEPSHIVSALKQFSHRFNEVIAFHIIDPAEQNLDFNADSELIDIETRLSIATDTRHIQAVYQKAFEKRSHYYKNALADNHIDYNLLLTSNPFDEALFAYLKKRSKIK